MTLYNAKQFSVDSHGAYVTNLTDSTGNPILFEQIMIGEKRRGGSHVCLPYFGVDAAGVFPQHGFGRDVEWEVESLDVIEGNREISCVYEEREHELFSGLRASMLYHLNADLNSFSTALTIINDGDKTFSISPGFHPYFAVDPNDVRLNGELVNLAHFEPYKDFPNTEEMCIETGGRMITIWSKHLRHMVVWTDMSGSFLCVEPTRGGHGFDSSSQGGDRLSVGDSVSYAYHISWS